MRLIAIFSDYDTLGRPTGSLQSQVVPLLHTWYKYDAANRVVEQYYRLNPTFVNLSGAVNIAFDTARCDLPSGHKLRIADTK